ncbi:hypothetical protein SBA4_710025 [Candidatus Sulfopaludibacter sp. SbA4]|nr:hypothetical protein SBA4_710025 [Candidatus Sulfopaludibacter sp. SbA4]
MDLEMAETPEGLVLKPADQRPSMVRVNGFWVHQGIAPKGLDWSRFIEEERDGRHRRVRLSPRSV